MEEEEFIRHMMFRIPLQDVDRSESLFRLREDYQYIIKAMTDSSLDPSRLERLRQFRIDIREMYLELTRREIEDDIADSL